LVSIHVNSGRATRERHIEETAYKTNLEAADEIARQLRLRDLAGLIVIDFIDMEERRNNQNVERRLKDALRGDRARIQIGRISPFGLLEMSRQRLRPSLMETSFLPCPQCGGTGHVRSVESTAVHILRAIEEEGIKRRSAEITIYVPVAVALYILNQKRQALGEIEARHGFHVLVAGDESLISPQHRIERTKDKPKEDENISRPVSSETHAAIVIADEQDEEDEPEEEDEAEVEAGEGAESQAESADSQDKRGKRRRRRRGKRGERDGEPRAASPSQSDAAEGEEGADEEAGEGDDASAGPEQASEPGEDGAKRKRRRGRRGGRRRRGREGEGEQGSVDENGAGPTEAAEPRPAQDEQHPVPALRDEPALPMVTPEAALPMVVEEAPLPVTVEPEDNSGKPKRKGWWNQLLG
ncbi:MAG: ribonuclease E/G, partial [Rhodospirillales bacterium]